MCLILWLCETWIYCGSLSLVGSQSFDGILNLIGSLYHCESLNLVGSLYHCESLNLGGSLNLVIIRTCYFHWLLFRMLSNFYFKFKTMKTHRLVSWLVVFMHVTRLLIECRHIGLDLDLMKKTYFMSCFVIYCMLVWYEFELINIKLY